MLSAATLTIAGALGYVGALALAVGLVVVSLPFVWFYDGHEPRAEVFSALT